MGSSPIFAVNVWVHAGSPNFYHLQLQAACNTAVFLLVAGNIARIQASCGMSGLKDMLLCEAVFPGVGALPPRTACALLRCASHQSVMVQLQMIISHSCACPLAQASLFASGVVCQLFVGECQCPSSMPYDLVERPQMLWRIPCSVCQ